MIKRTALATAILAAVGPGQALAGTVAEYVTEQMRVDFYIQSNDFIYRVTNLGQTPIVGFELPQHSCYFFRAPKGWLIETPDGRFEARAPSPQKGILPYQTGQFSFRVSSKGAVLGRGPAKVRFQSGPPVELPEVLAPSGEPPGHLAAVAGTILVLFLLHGAVGTWRNRRAKRAALSGG